MPNLDLNILQILYGDTPVNKIMYGDTQIWPILPYDTKIEYLEGTGTQWIDTGIRFDTNKHGYEVDGILINDKSGTVTICGIYEGNFDTSHLASVINGNYQNGYFFCPSGNFRGAGSRSALGQVGVRNKVGFINHGVENGTINITRTVNGVSTDLTMTNPYIGISVQTVPILGVKGRGANAIGEIPHFKLYGFKMFDKTVPILDLIPVRSGQVGYMYDKISGRLFGNAGTGSFTLGPDVT